MNCKEFEKNKLLNLMSEHYELPEKDKVYICRYYKSLVNDLIGVTLHAKHVMGEESEMMKDYEADFDLQEFFVEKRDYAVKTIAHMVTLLDFAANFCLDIRGVRKETDCKYYHSMKEFQGREEKIRKLVELFIEQLGEEIQEELWENLMIDMGKIVPICHGCYAQNLGMTIQSVRSDYPDFADDIVFIE